jgi:hypothetical protein
LTIKQSVGKNVRNTSEFRKLDDSAIIAKEIRSAEDVARKGTVENPCKIVVGKEK